MQRLPKVVAVAALAIALVGVFLLSQRAEGQNRSGRGMNAPMPPGVNLYPPDQIRWQPGPRSLPPGAEYAVLEGDPSKEGPFVMRIRVPDGYRIPPHWHPKTERVTVMSGTFNL